MKSILANPKGARFLDNTQKQIDKIIGTDIKAGVQIDYNDYNLAEITFQTKERISDEQLRELNKKGIYLGRKSISVLYGDVDYTFYKESKFNLREN